MRLIPAYLRTPAMSISLSRNKKKGPSKSAAAPKSCTPPARAIVVCALLTEVSDVSNDGVVLHLGHVLDLGSKKEENDKTIETTR